MSDYEWVTVRSTMSIVENQCPSPYRRELFADWIKDCWEIVSVMTLPPISSCDMCIAVGVLKKLRA